MQPETSRRLKFLVAFLTMLMAGTATASEIQKPKDSAEHTQRRLFDIFDQSDEHQLASDPLGAMARGDSSFADQFGDFGAPAYFAWQKAQGSEVSRQLAEIDRSQLSETDRVSYDAFLYQQDLERRGFELGAAKILRELGLDPLFGYHISFPEMSTGKSSLPFATLQDYQNGLERLRGFTRYLHRARVVMKEGIKNQHTLPRFAALKVISQLNDAVALGVDRSPFMIPLQVFPEGISAKDQVRLNDGYQQVLTKEVLPAFKRLSDFMTREYLPNCRSGRPGLSHMKDGELLYRHLVELHAGTRLSPQKIHQIGLDEVDRIRQNMEAIRRQVQFEGSLKEFFAHLQSAPRFKFSTEKDLLGAYEEIRTRVLPEVAKLFSGVPRTPLEIRPVPSFLEKNAIGAYYNSGSPDGSRPGVFYVNTYDLPSRTRPTTETLFLHEAIPGHHFQAGLAQENESLPPFQRFGWSTAFIEGWALYAESLGHELGLFQDPYQHFGHLELEMFRALRLVVDTGLHTMNWSRSQAVDYMSSHCSLEESVLKTEVDRYVVWPGQALAYKWGQLAIGQLRAESEQALGEKFDIREFHDQVLSSGILPIPILEAKVHAWVENQKESRTKNSEVSDEVRPNGVPNEVPAASQPH